MLKVLSGDFKEAKFRSGLFQSHGTLLFPSPDWWNPFLAKYPPERITKITEITEENKKDFTSAAGWAALGGLALGPLGLLAGAVFGGRKKSIYFAVILDDGRRAVIEAPPQEWARIVAAYV